MTEEQKVDKLVAFIKDNDLDFKTTGSSLNSAVVVLCGFALYIDGPDEDLSDEDLISAVDRSFLESKEKIPTHARVEYVDEIYRVFEYACDNNYGTWWSSPLAAKQYKF